MAGKTDALVKDLAALFIKYRLSDWQPIVDMLRSGSAQSHELANEVRRLCETAARSHAPKSARRKGASAREADFLSHVAPERRLILGELKGALTTKQLLPRAGDLRAIYLGAGGKMVLPPRREAAIRVFVAHISQLPDGKFTSVLNEIAGVRPPSASHLDDYSRWFDMIYSSKKE
jgi:hypothetical protein